MNISAVCAHIKFALMFDSVFSFKHFWRNKTADSSQVNKNENPIGNGHRSVNGISERNGLRAEKKSRERHRAIDCKWNQRTEKRKNRIIKKTNK